jgi:ribosome-associated toxin RatA of RatAB toxin-antitoxin module
MIPQHDTGSLLRAALRTNACFSLVSGLALVIAAGEVRGLLDLGPALDWVLRGIGVGLVGFAALLLSDAARPGTELRRAGVVAVACDAAWVAGSAVLVLLADLTPQGGGVVGAVALAVGVFAAVQVLGLWQLGDGSGAELEVMRAARHVATAPATAWALVSDHAAYGRIAPGLESVRVTSAPGEPLERRCVASSGASWREHCTLWTPGERFAVDVDTTDYPFPLSVMRGEWGVDPADGGTEITMRFAYRGRPGLRGALFAALLRPGFTVLVLPRILSRWQRQLEAPGPALSARARES